MKKNFEQPELMVVRINTNDVIATSDKFTLDTNSAHSIDTQFAPGMRGLDDYYEGY